MLKVALRRDAAPFGYIDRAGNWTGYCRDFAADLQSYVSQTIRKTIDVDLVELPSTLANRFSLVQENIVHLECGPNTIRQDIEGVTFSLPLLVSGAQFLVKQERIDRENPNPRLADVRVAVLPETTTEEFIRETFPQAEVIPFAGPTGRHEAVTALATGQVDVLASDGILSMGELLRQNRPLADYALEPERPLTCEFYGLILPAGDPDWQDLVNTFISNTHSERLSRQEPNRLFADQITILDYCLNQQTDEPLE
ncbi:MAG: transporter substrate-binding domain-containing protein [Leptolyngbyaceae cyanobacterium MO_188.B28]|nr:transporter substrate-binding domain-containing protein [Leptolyngbyaceae cyanobacterium MO_188.B28]